MKFSNEDLEVQSLQMHRKYISLQGFRILDNIKYHFFPNSVQLRDNLIPY